MFYSTSSTVYIAGFDAYKQQDTYYHIDQERRWKTEKHNLNYEWQIFESFFEAERAKGRNIIIQKDSSNE